MLNQATTGLAFAVLIQYSKDFAGVTYTLQVNGYTFKWGNSVKNIFVTLLNRSLTWEAERETIFSFVSKFLLYK